MEKVLEKNHSITILVTLVKANKMFFSELKKESQIGSSLTISSRLEDLKKADLIKDKTEETTEKGRYVGVKRYIWLTPKGKKIAEKLVEIESILE